MLVISAAVVLASRNQELDASGCAEAAAIELITLPGVGHDWMRSPVLDATSEVLDFLGSPLAVEPNWS